MGDSEPIRTHEIGEPGRERILSAKQTRAFDNLVRALNPKPKPLD